MAYFETVTNDPTLMEIASHESNATHDVPNTSIVGSATGRGKDMASLKEQFQFYCEDCQRGLADEKAHEKHLKSELHFKRSLKGRAINEIKEPRVKVKQANTTSLYLNESGDIQIDENETLSRESDRYQVCATCHSTVEKIQFGKHLISHYHHHMSLSGNKEQNNALILENIEKIVKECPFQCHICNFFCNWDHEFIAHWESVHDNTLCDRDGTKMYWCSFCRRLIPTCGEMSSHLKGENHNEILSVINRCVPMIIKVCRMTTQAANIATFRTPSIPTALVL